MAKKKKELTESEWAIIQVVWRQKRCTAPDVTEILKARRGWSYSTVKTLMDRMVEKGLLEIEKMRNLILYSAVISKKDAQKGEIMKTVKRAFDGALTPMMQFMLDSGELSDEQLDEIAKLLKNNRKKNNKKK